MSQNLYPSEPGDNFKYSPRLKSTLNPNRKRVDMSLAPQNSNSTRWDDLRKKARHIEQDLDVKLVSFSRLGTNHLSSASNLGFSDKTTLLDDDGNPQISGNSQSDDMFKTMAMEIQSLLEKLTEINQELSDFSQKNSQSSNSYAPFQDMPAHGNAAMLHTLQRHRDILQDFQHEYNKIKTNIETQREREDLLGSVRRDIDMHYRQQQQIKSRSNSGMAIPGQTDHFMKERERLLTSDRLTNEAIEMGIQTREELANQRKQYTGMTQRVMGVMSKFPVINSLVHRINWRKKRDSLIMACVISVCSFFILVYWIRQ